MRDTFDDREKWLARGTTRLAGARANYAVKKSTESIEEFISGTLIDGVRATLSPDELLRFEGLTFDKLPSSTEGTIDDLARHECGSLN
jgi:hypothetical protein